MVQYRVDELAVEAGISVDVLRSYQSKGLLPAPRHEGRVAWYGEVHLERLRAVRDLKARGHSLRAIASLLSAPQARERRFKDAVPAGEHATLTLAELAERTRVPPAMLRSLEGSGVLRPRSVAGEPRYSGADVRAVRMLLSLVGSGLPMEEFMRVAGIQLEAADRLAHEAVELFLRYVREPLLASPLDEGEQAERLVAGFRLLDQACNDLISYNFTRTLLSHLHEELARRGTPAEWAAFEREVDRRRESTTR